MPLWNIGSVIDEVSARITVPIQLSGCKMENSVVGAINTMINWTGVNPGSVGIDEKYQEALVCLTASKIALSVQALQSSTTGIDSGASYTINDFSFDGDSYNNGQNSRVHLSQKAWEDMAASHLKQMGYRMKFGKANG